MKKLLVGATSALSLITTIAAQTSSYTYEDDAVGTGFVFGSILLYCICLLGIFLIWGGVSYLIYKDAVKNNVDNPILWALLTFFLGLLGIVLYLVVGKNKEK